MVAANTDSTPMNPASGGDAGSLAPVAMSTGGTPAGSIFESPNSSLPTSGGLPKSTVLVAEIKNAFSRKFMNMTMEYIVMFQNADTRLGVNVSEQLGSCSVVMDALEAKEDVNGMSALYGEIQKWDAEVAARKKAWKEAGGVNDGEEGARAARLAKEVELRRINEIASEIASGVLPMEAEADGGSAAAREFADKQLEREEAEMEQEMAELRSPSQEGRASLVTSAGATAALAAAAATVERVTNGKPLKGLPTTVKTSVSSATNTTNSLSGTSAAIVTALNNVATGKSLEDPMPQGLPAPDAAKPTVAVWQIKKPLPDTTNNKGTIAVQDEDDNRMIDIEEREDETTYAKYAAKGIRDLHPLAHEHPDPLVETASLRSVPMPPLNFQHCLQEEVDKGIISDAQLETVIYANMRYRQPDRPRLGFFLGDGAGVGKGRQIAALCKQHWHDGGRRILWVSVSQDLRIDTRRDLKDVNAEFIPVHSDGSPDQRFEGVVFCTYSFLRMKLPKPKQKPKLPFGKQADENEDDQNKMERLEAIPASCNLGKLIKWLGACPEGSLIVLDESHKAKNLLPPSGTGLPTQTGRAIMYLQERLPDAKVLYSSATGASEPKNLAYMHRLGIGGVGNIDELVQMLVKANTETLELAAMSLKSAGAYLGRTLSYDGAEFDLVRVTLESSFETMYNRCSPVWAALYRVGKAFGEKMWASKYWGANQRFFKSMLMAGKVPSITKMAKEALLDGMCVVIGLQSTGEAATEQARAKKDEEDMTDLISAPRMSLSKCVALLVRFDRLLDTLEREMKQSKNYGPDWQYNPRVGYADIDRISAILDVHKETYEMAQKIRQQPSIAAILMEQPEGGTGLSVEDVQKRLDAKMAEHRRIEADKRRVTVERIKSNDDAEKSKLLKEMEKLDEDLQAVKHAVAGLLEAKADIENNVGTFSGRSSGDIRDMIERNARGEREVPVPVLLLEPYVKPEPTAETSGQWTMEDMEQICNDIIDWYSYIAERLDLPANPLDDLIHNLGGQDRVAELTGRKGGIFFDDDGNAEYRDRKAGESAFKKSDVNLYEKDLFMRGEKLIAIISDASSTGISLQADKRVANLRRRCHITLELPWSADKAIQQFGRSHRANQMSAPVYKMVVTPCGGEYRFACAASKRLASLGALLRGDRNALGAGSDLKAFDIDSELGQKALRKFLLSFCTRKLPQGGRKIADRSLPEELALDLEDGTSATPTEKFLSYFFGRFNEMGLEIRSDKLNCTVPTFLNRLLGFTILEQELVFKYFSDVMEHQREIMINDGTLERGILSMDVEATLKETEVVYTDPRTQSKIFHHVVSTDKGKPWSYVKQRLSDTLRAFGAIPAVSQFSGFYIKTNPVSGKDANYTLNGEKVPMIKLVTVNPDDNAVAHKSGETTQYLKSFAIFPNSEFPKRGKLNDEQSAHRRATIQEAEAIWTKWYDYMDIEGCRHGDKCKMREEHGYCTQTRRDDLHLLTGGLLEFMTRLHDLVEVSSFLGRTYTGKDKSGAPRTMRYPLEIVRVITDTGEPVVGYKAVSKAEMQMFKHQLLLKPGDPDDLVRMKKGTAHLDQVAERKRKEQERVANNMAKQQKQQENRRGTVMHGALSQQTTLATASATAQASGLPDFIPSPSYQAYKEGYLYKEGPKGLGYYRFK